MQHAGSRPATKFIIQKGGLIHDHQIACRSIRLLSAAAVVFLAVAGVTACSEQGNDRTSEVADADSQAEGEFTAGKGDAWGANVNVTGTRHITLASITAYGD